VHLKKYLALASLRVHPVLVLHLAGDALEVGLHDGVLDALQPLLPEVSLLAAGDDFEGRGGGAGAANMNSDASVRQPLRL
jgi:hypothetical protein